MRTVEFIKRVEGRAPGGLSRDDAERTTRATLRTLASRISEDEASALRSQLPRELADALRPRQTEPLSPTEFVDRVAADGGVSRSEALDRVRAVMHVLSEAVTPAELAHVRAELPADYEMLFAPPAVAGQPEAHIGASALATEPEPRPRAQAAPEEAAPAFEVDVVARGPVPHSALDDARRRIGALRDVVDGPVLGARVVMTQEQNPRMSTPARAEGEIDLPGVQVRARAAGETMQQAVAALAARLRRRLRERIELIIAGHRLRAEPQPGEWHHGATRTDRPDYFPRPPGEREIVRRKSFGIEEMDAAEAAASMEALDHDFFLFHDVETDADAVIYRGDDGRLGVNEPAKTTWDVEDAVREMDELDGRFLFYVNARTGRGNVIYRRYDGHYGIVEPPE